MGPPARICVTAVLCFPILVRLLREGEDQYGEPLDCQWRHHKELFKNMFAVERLTNAIEKFLSAPVPLIKVSSRHQVTMTDPLKAAAQVHGQN